MIFQMPCRACFLSHFSGYTTRLDVDNVKIGIFYLNVFEKLRSSGLTRRMCAQAWHWSDVCNPTGDVEYNCVVSSMWKEGIYSVERDSNIVVEGLHELVFIRMPEGWAWRS